jgi:small subunit ribosomal protein S18
MANFYSKKVCRFCAEHIDHIDYKDVKLLQRFLSGYGKIESRKRTGTCLKHQRRLAIALKRSRHLALLPFVVR